MAAQRLHAIGAPAEGYVIPASGIINLRDASGRKLKPPFNVGKGEDVARKKFARLRRANFVIFWVKVYHLLGACLRARPWG